VLAVVVATTGAVERTSVSASARPARAPLAASAPVGSMRVLVAGDSVAWHLGHSFERLAPELGFTTANVAFDGCSLEKGATAARYFTGGEVELSGHDCTTGWNDAVARFQPQVVVLLLAGQVLGDWQVDGEWTRICERRYDDWYSAQLRDGVDLLTAQGARVVLVAPPPSTLAGIPPDLNRGNECIREIEQRLAEANPSVTSLDLTPLICPSGRCRSEIDGVTLRPDGMHFEGAGADIVTRWLAPKLRAVAEQPPT
jgi:lysophospholipase L1-like esterase